MCWLAASPWAAAAGSKPSCGAQIRTSCGRHGLELPLPRLREAGYEVPRFGMGAFLSCLEALWRRRHGSELQVQVRVGLTVHG